MSTVDKVDYLIAKYEAKYEQYEKSIYSRMNAESMDRCEEFLEDLKKLRAFMKVKDLIEETT